MIFFYFDTLVFEYVILILSLILVISLDNWRRVSENEYEEQSEDPDYYPDACVGDEFKEAHFLGIHHFL